MNLEQYISQTIVKRARRAIRKLQHPRGPATDVVVRGPQAHGSIFVGRGEMFDRIHDFNWASTALGSQNDWPGELRTAINIVLSSSVPMCLMWGPKRILLYNDGCVPLLAGKHPNVLGQPLSDELPAALSLFGERWPGEVTALRTFVEDQCVLTERDGRLQEMFISYTLNPIPTPKSSIAGMLLSAVDTTSRVIGDRRAHTLLEVSAGGVGAAGAHDALLRSAAVLAHNPYDVPFALLYWIDAGSKRAELMAHTGLEPGTAASPVCLALDDAKQPWPAAAVLESRKAVLVSDVQLRFPGLVAGVFAAPITRARIQPLAIDGSGERTSTTPRGLLITGLSPRTPVIDDCPRFHELLGVTISNVVSAALNHEAQQQQVAALASLDRAKTEFFTRLSHELRTPLTLILGPLEDELAAESSLDPAGRSRLELAYRSALRLLRLTQALLDFARFDAGRSRPSFEWVELSHYTAELAESFRSAFERVGLTLEIDCRPLPEPIQVDREMWEKAVFNLLSNALKYTWQGGARVAMRVSGNNVELEVSDTGVGIAAEDLPQVFERFARIHGANGRSHDGAGIGLSLVRDILRLHQGDLSVSSEPGRGSRFLAHLPRRRAPQPAYATSPARMSMEIRTAALRDVYIEDAVGCALDHYRKAAPDAEPGGADRARILWVDDHPDLREYVHALLSEHWNVTAVASVAEALVAVQSQRPDLVLSDVTRPELQGLGLLRALRADASTRDVPVIMLSARPGENFVLGDLELGAEDYLLKPFAARELVARVRTHLQLARARRALTAELERQIETRTRELAEAGQQLQASLAQATAARIELERTVEERRKAMDELRDSEEKLRQLAVALQEASSIVDATSGAVLYVSPAYERIWCRSCESLYATPGSWLDAIVDEDRERVEQAFMRTREIGMPCEEEFRIRTPDGGLRWIRARAFPVYGASHRVLRVASAAEDITERKRNEIARESLEWQLRQSQKLEALGTLTGGIAHDFNNLLSVILGNCDLIRYELTLQERSAIGESLEEICAAGTRARDLVQRLLSFGRPKQQQPSAVDLQPILADVVKLLRATLPAGVELTLQSGSALPKVRADETLIHQVVLNLGTNAWQALDGRSGRVEINIEAVQVDGPMAAAHATLAQGPHIHLSVRDTGCGMDAEQIEHIFEPFFTTRSSNGGTGLGLSVVHGIVHSLGGCIIVESKPGAGSTFHVYLPASSEALQRPSALPPEIPSVAGRAELLLFVDDEPALVRIAVAQMERMGYRVEAYTQPMAALEAFRAQPTRFDLVITDYNMPQMSGIDFSRQVLSIRPDTVIVLVSGHMRSNELERAQASGIREVVSKPVLFDELGAIVRRLLAKALVQA